MLAVAAPDSQGMQFHDLARVVLVDMTGRVLFVVDDRQRVVDMWRAEGITCLQCEAWPEYKRPKKEKANAGVNP